MEDNSEKTEPSTGVTVVALEATIGDDVDEYEQRALQLGTVVEITAEEKEEERKLLRKIDLHMMPLLMITFGMQYSDKIGISSGVAFGFAKDTHLVGQQYAWLSTGFYLAMLISEFPVNWLMQRYRIDRILCYAVFFWGVCVFGIAACNNFTQLMAVRTLLGIGEACVNPGFLIVISAWYKKDEQHFRSMLFLCVAPNDSSVLPDGNFSMMDAFFALWILMVFYGLGVDSTKIQGWRSINLFLGAVSVVWSAVLIFFLGTPKTVRWLTPEEKARAHARLVANQQGESESGVRVKWSEVREAFADPMSWFNVVFGLLYCMSAGGIAAFSSYILQSFGATGAQSIAYQIPWYGCQFLGEVIGSWVIYKNPKKNWNLIICMICQAPALAGILLQALLNNDHKWGRIVGFWIGGFFPPSIFIVWSQTGLNVAGRTKKSVVQGMVAATFAVGYMIGPQAFQAKDAPGYRPGLYFCASCYGCLTIWSYVWRFWVARENARRDQIVAASGMDAKAAELEGRINALKGMTDRQNIHFRYKY
ncbi:major facilitator superfamily domain-containing protein [Naematelia encephala]|uniref:Major facilitator superfamily domain-containing protein n=1 Tax=Naematelia encephala TaxID=71784 RepID=A0A1Y2B4F8_9TREE|nr:major facilitator superfamily domain-containing protein [Naematelia encephala]